MASASACTTKKTCGRPRFTDPEILRSSLAGVILRMKSLHLGVVEDFPFIALGPGHCRRLPAAMNWARWTTNELAHGARAVQAAAGPRVGRMILEARARAPSARCWSSPAR
jgi:ATP-dependent helicase HrpA